MQGYSGLEIEPSHDEEEEERLIGGASTTRSKNTSSSSGSASLRSIGQLLTSKYAIIYLAILGIGLALFLIDTTVVEDIDSALMSKPATKTFISKPHPHTSSFGGINNVAHPGGVKAYAAGKGIVHEDIVIPDYSKNSHLYLSTTNAIPSLNRENIINQYGHYVHDEHRSPYASHLYNHSKDILEEQQTKFLAKMEAVRKEWGAWDFHDKQFPDGGRPYLDFFERKEYGDIFWDATTTEEEHTNIWQLDEEYVSDFISEAKKLVNRVTEGIYAEYGFPLKKKDGTEMTEEEKKERDLHWKVNTIAPEEDIHSVQTGIASIYQSTLDGLVKKLLHSIITNDNFYAVLAGHSAAAGHGNDFHQNRIMTFHNIMEPVFDKLGMRLISRNMGMGGVGTLQFSLAGGDLYGETDILEWDSGMTEKGPSVDFFNKQLILSGERVPVILTPYMFDIMKETNYTAYMGDYVNDKLTIPYETTYENFKDIPFAARWFDEKKNPEEKYNAICWEPRIDFTPPREQASHPGSQVGWHPGFRQHNYQGRRLALVVLHGLKVALETWEEGIQKDGFPLKEKYWHIGNDYKRIRDHLQGSVTNTAENKEVPACETMLPWLPRICRVKMRGYGMWTPRAHESFDLLNIIKKIPNATTSSGVAIPENLIGHKPKFYESNIYNGFNLLPYEQALPDDVVDVHAIAIATTNPPPDDIDHTWVDDESGKSNVTGEEESSSPPSRRWLREQSNKAFLKASSIYNADDDNDNVDTTSAIDQRYNSLKISSDDISNSATIFRNDSMSDTNNHYYYNNRKLDEGEEIIPGLGWEVHGWKVVKGFCDGSINSECGRSSDNKCLFYNANDNHLDVWGNALSGWVVFTLPLQSVQEGIILLRGEWWCGGNDKGTNHLLTKDWAELNNGGKPITLHKNRKSRELGGLNVDNVVPEDHKMDFVVKFTNDNGDVNSQSLPKNEKIVVSKTWEREEFLTHIGEPVKNVAIWPMLDDENWKENHSEVYKGDNNMYTNIEVAVRFRSELSPHQPYCMSHLYYA